MIHTRILMVCLGNICRSPLAEGILKSMVNPDFIYIDSAGTSAFHKGELPDPRSIKVAQKNGIDITDQKSRQFIATDFDVFDTIYVMDQSNQTNVLALAKNDEDRNKVKLILNERKTASNENVPDPYHDTDNGFDAVYSMLNDACKQIADKL